MADYQIDVGDRPELRDMMKALGKAQNPNEVEYDPDYPPFDQEEFERAWFTRKRGGGYGSPGDF